MLAVFPFKPTTERRDVARASSFRPLKRLKPTSRKRRANDGPRLPPFSRQYVTSASRQMAVLTCERISSERIRYGEKKNTLLTVRARETAANPICQPARRNYGTRTGRTSRAVLTEYSEEKQNAYESFGRRNAYSGYEIYAGERFRLSV